MVTLLSWWALSWHSQRCGKSSTKKRATSTRGDRRAENDYDGRKTECSGATILSCTMMTEANEKTVLVVGDSPSANDRFPRERLDGHCERSEIFLLGRRSIQVTSGRRAITGKSPVICHYLTMTSLSRHWYGLCLSAECSKSSVSVMISTLFHNLPLLSKQQPFRMIKRTYFVFST